MSAAAAQCINTSRRALYRVFVSPVERTMLPLALSRPDVQPTIPSQLRSYVRIMPARGPRGQTSTSATEKVARDERGFDKRYTTQQDIARSGRDRPPQDHEITDPQIMVIDNDVAEGPLSTQYVLTKLEPHESLRMVRPYVPADPANDMPECQYAVCKIVDKKDEYERQKQIRERKKAAVGKLKTKELELTWAIGEHDLATKLRQMGGFLAKGFKVDLLVARKKRGRQADEKEALGVVKRIRQEVEDSGGKEAKPATGEVGSTMRFYLEGKPGV